MLFSAGTKSFAEVEFYLLRIDTAPITLNEKLELVKAYAKNLSMEYFMSENPIL